MIADIKHAKTRKISFLRDDAGRDAINWGQQEALVVNQYKYTGADNLVTFQDHGALKDLQR
ncbi:Hypothetical protein FKW44_004098 [Caligus rogercresseyi]|uniref:Uncharacterized protein n=1 Tax=Caligus rogercresseyi TaxID=217165 RepID=A0A7T8HL55_CALRO|nr:Hypothetical protein FKW44_004098 [Caligus rogercresseyi]